MFCWCKPYINCFHWFSRWYPLRFEDSKHWLFHSNRPTTFNYVTPGSKYEYLVYCLDRESCMRKCQNFFRATFFCLFYPPNRSKRVYARHPKWQIGTMHVQVACTIVALSKYPRTRTYTSSASLHQRIDLNKFASRQFASGLLNLRDSASYWEWLHLD